jgi:hypothetical protein
MPDISQSSMLFIYTEDADKWPKDDIDGLAMFVEKMNVRVELKAYRSFINNKNK